MARLNYHHLHYFWAVAREGNLTRAAARLHVSQSALSNQIRQLEESFGQPLFARVGRTLKLTEAGHLALAYSESIFASGNELLALLRDGHREQRQVLRIGAMATLSTAIYVAMGWVIIIAIKPLMASMDHAGLMLLIAGGLCYTGGVIFYVDRRRAWAHPVWHLFVMGGSVCHYFAVLWYAAPAH